MPMTLSYLQPVFRKGTRSPDPGSRIHPCLCPGAAGAAGTARNGNNPRGWELLFPQVSHGVPSAGGAAGQRTDHASPPGPSRTDAFCHLGERNLRRSSTPRGRGRRVGFFFFSLPNICRHFHFVKIKIYLPLCARYAWKRRRRRQRRRLWQGSTTGWIALEGNKSGKTRSLARPDGWCR